MFLFRYVSFLNISSVEKHIWHLAVIEVFPILLWIKVIENVIFIFISNTVQYEGFIVK